jgi:hypothetical protein
MHVANRRPARFSPSTDLQRRAECGIVHAIAAVFRRSLMQRRRAKAIATAQSQVTATRLAIAAGLFLLPLLLLLISP